MIKFLYNTVCDVGKNFLMYTFARSIFYCYVVITNALRISANSFHNFLRRLFHLESLISVNFRRLHRFYSSYNGSIFVVLLKCTDA